MPEKKPTTPVRVRYAPSPTGLQHIGGVRTALFNYLFARSCGGQFILRIEDTDLSRSEDHYIQDLYESLEWLGIQADEGPRKYQESLENGRYLSTAAKYGPYIQSERIELYRRFAQQLLDERKAYYCFCSAERLAQLRRKQEQSKSPQQGYDRHCRSIPALEAKQRHENGEATVLRFAIPLEGSSTFHDLLLGDIQRDNKDINPDPVILKSDAFPTYHLANVIDDHLMEISHVLRAQEWLSSGPLHMLLYQALAWEPPKFCHLPMVIGQDGAKLSKRHGSASLIEFRKAGYLSEAVLNYIALLGWAFDDSREFFTLKELEQSFDLAKLSRSPATFDYQKLEWFNGHYIRQHSIEQLRQSLLPLWAEQEPQIYSQELLDGPEFFHCLEWILPLLQERLKFLTDAPSLAAYFFQRPSYSEPKLALPKKHNAAQAAQLLRTSRTVLQQLSMLESESENWHDFASLLEHKQKWEAAFRAAAQEAEVKMGPLMQPLRYAITGSNVSPPLLESIMILHRLAGVQELLQRIDLLAQTLEKLAQGQA